MDEVRVISGAVSETLGRLVPIAAVAVDLGDAVPALWPEEEALVANASPARRDEFARGRTCARMALSKLDVSVGAILRDERMPAWPVSVAGSITHCPGLVAAVAMRRTSVFAVGLDAEPVGRVTSHLARKVLAPPEEDAGLSDSMKLTAVWCAKEAVYKCVYPNLRQFIDFRDVAVTLDLDAERFAVSWSSNSLVSSLTDTLDGRITSAGGYVLATCVWPSVK